MWRIVFANQWGPSRPAWRTKYECCHWRSTFFWPLSLFHYFTFTLFALGVEFRLQWTLYILISRKLSTMKAIYRCRPCRMDISSMLNVIDHLRHSLGNNSLRLEMPAPGHSLSCHRSRYCRHNSNSNSNNREWTHWRRRLVSQEWLRCLGKKKAFIDIFICVWYYCSTCVCFEMS